MRFSGATNLTIFFIIPLILAIGIIPVLPMADALEARQERLASQPSETECRTGQTLVFQIRHNQFFCTSQATAERWQQLGLAKIVEQIEVAQVREDETEIPSEQLPATEVSDPRFEMEKECPGGNVFLENPSNGFIHCANIFSVPTLLLQGWVILDDIPTSETDYHFPHLTKCEEGEAELKHSSTGHIICTSTDKVDSLFSEGWELFTPPELSDLEIQSLLNIEEEIQDAPYTTNLEILETDEQDVYQVIFQECAEDSSIRDPVILITSDTQQQKIQLMDTLHRNDCTWGVTHIRALDPSTIKAQTVEFGDNENLVALEEKIQELQQQVEKERQELVRVKNMNFDTHQDYIDAVREQADNLRSVGRELRSLTSEYYTILYYLHR